MSRSFFTGACQSLQHSLPQASKVLQEGEGGDSEQLTCLSWAILMSGLVAFALFIGFWCGAEAPWASEERPLADIAFSISWQAISNSVAERISVECPNKKNRMKTPNCRRFAAASAREQSDGGRAEEEEQEGGEWEPLTQKRTPRNDNDVGKTWRLNQNRRDRAGNFLVAMHFDFWSGWDGGGIVSPARLAWFAHTDALDLTDFLSCRFHHWCSRSTIHSPSGWWWFGNL